VLEEFLLTIYKALHIEKETENIEEWIKVWKPAMNETSDALLREKVEKHKGITKCVKTSFKKVACKCTCVSATV